MTNDDIKPTEQGKRRYPSTGGYNADVNPAEPCTCVDTCKSRCAGECGCRACRIQFAEYCDMVGWLSDKPWEPTEAQLAQYRGEDPPHTLTERFGHFMNYSGLAVQYADQPDVVSNLLLAYAHGSEGGQLDDSKAPVLPDQVDELRRQLLAGEISWYPKPKTP